ncbi:methyltransferase domain-containing protein [Stappia stellulata]|uniref:class I SAM-dependent methyltransferase n=1 Tax=Stappia stellulata TaxID=71235 RepID=UPI001CD505BB|nr:class I SAM-dependent methyltransferase [Stappia stellulata]MCA1242927.1 methyltransferase domain-containing protein [Stappia stellulata]
MTDWTFRGFEGAFDAHVREQLPWYELASDAAALIARHYIPKGGLVYDIGCSTGNVGRALAGVLEERHAQLIALDECPDMVRAYQAPGTAICADAATFDYQPFDVAILFLTLMFLPVSQRLKLLAHLRASLKPGGCIIVFDKSVTAPGYEGTVLARLTWHNKLQSGATPHDVAEKEMKLIGVQRPIDRREIDPAIEVFRFADFGGWIITPEINPCPPA